MRRLVILISFLASPLVAQSNSDVAIIVEFRDPPLALRSGVSAKAVTAEYQAAFQRFRSDIKTYRNISYEYHELFNGVALTVPAAEIPAIRQLSYVKNVQLDLPVYALSATPSANITKIRADQVWSTMGTKGRGVVVAIIDTGVDYRHPALGGCLGAGCKVIGGYDFVNKDDDPMDDNQHGTHVAGIIAADSDALVGVAPDVSLLAYKVLSGSGSGKTSDVIAGIERAADPNNDGDFSDHADVANLSLGGIGNPDDASSTAIDRGTGLGVVYCIAAGNSGAFHTIGSPGCARTAITVGATDNNDGIASFTSRGPNIKNGAIKPDVMAPGVAIVSSVPNGKYAALSGTSMATPHVAGVAALVKSLHHDWTPDQIKSAIVDTASVLAQEIMTQGGGRVDAMGAARSTVFITPSSISLGEDHLPQTSWSPSATLHVVNSGAQSATITLGAISTSSLTIAATPSRLTLEPGASADVKISYGITNAGIIPGTSLGFGGTITVTSSATTDAIHVPWAAIKAARVLVSYDRAVPAVSFIDRTAGTSSKAIPMDGSTLEAYLRASSYDLLLTWSQFDPNTLRDTDLRIHYADAQNVADDTSFALNTTQASHTITLAAQNESGQPLVGSDYSGYGSTGRIVLPAGSKPASVVLSAYSTRTWHVSDIAEKLLLEELNYSFLDSHFYIVPLSPLDGVHSDATLTAGGSDLKRVSASLALAPPQTGDQRIVLYVQPITPPGDSSGLLGLVLHPTAPYFNVTVFLGPDTDPSYSVGTQLVSITDGATRFAAPLLRILNGKLIASNTTQPPSWIYDGDGFVFGYGLQFPQQSFSQGSTSLKPNLFTDFVGQLGETRLGDRSSTSTTIYAADSSVQATGSKYPMPLDLTQTGAYTIAAVDTGVLTQGVPRRSTVTSTVDSNRADFYAPTFTAMMLFDANGQIATHLDPHRAGSLEFAAADYAYPASGPRTYQPIAADQTKVWFRYSGSQMWQPLTASQVTEDPALGILFRVDLTSVANADNVLVDMKFDIVDTSGNTTSYMMEPAFAVGRDSWFGRRGPHR